MKEAENKEGVKGVADDLVCKEGKACCVAEEKSLNCFGVDGKGEPISKIRDEKENQRRDEACCLNVKGCSFCFEVGANQGD